MERFNRPLGRTAGSVDKACKIGLDGSLVKTDTNALQLSQKEVTAIGNVFKSKDFTQL